MPGLSFSAISGDATRGMLPAQPQLDIFETPVWMTRALYAVSLGALSGLGAFAWLVYRVSG
jgi:hypothetical protein